jgi:hypothetical protein
MEKLFCQRKQYACLMNWWCCHPWCLGYEYFIFNNVHVPTCKAAADQLARGYNQPFLRFCDPRKQQVPQCIAYQQLVIGRSTS